MSDDRFRDLVRRVAATSDPSDAGRLLHEAVRLGRWLTTREHGGDWNDNTHRLGTLRFLGYLGWGPAIELLRSLPLDLTGAHDAVIPVRDRVPPTAFGELGPDVAKTVAPTVLAAAAAAACMAVAHLLPETFDMPRAFEAYGRAITAQRVWVLSGHDRSLIGAVDEATNALRLHSRDILPNSRVRYDGPDERSPMANARFSADMAWGELLGAPGCHSGDRPKEYASAIFRATYALAWECEPDIPEGERPRRYVDQEWDALNERHWLRAFRLKRDWRDPYGAVTSVGCMRVAKKAMREAMLNPAIVAAATLVS